VTFAEIITPQDQIEVASGLREISMKLRTAQIVISYLQRILITRIEGLELAVDKRDPGM
jgi:hypothetical protein